MLSVSDQLECSVSAAHPVQFVLVMTSTRFFQFRSVGYMRVKADGEIVPGACCRLPRNSDVLWCMAPLVKLAEGEACSLSRFQHETL